MNYADWQLWARRELESAGHERDEAHALARLLLDRVAETRYAALLFPENSLDEPTRARLQSDLEQLCARVPLPHITGTAPFWGLEWNVASSTLIPRPETEFLVEAALERLKNRAPKKANSLRICDLGTGSGIVAVCLARELTLNRVWATEISPPAREIALKNAARYDVCLELISGVENDWLAPLEGQKPFDALVSNPPYIPTREIEELQPEVRIYEPRAALDGGADGLEPYRQMAARASEFVETNGFVALELGAGQFSDVRALFESANWRVEAPIYDLSGIERILVAWRD